MITTDSDVINENIKPTSVIRYKKISGKAAKLMATFAHTQRILIGKFFSVTLDLAAVFAAAAAEDCWVGSLGFIVVSRG